jgi:dienelactone hydrolase
VKRFLAGFASLCFLSIAAAGERVTLPGPGLELQGQLGIPDGKGPFPAIVLMHGCTGMWAPNGELTPLYRFWTSYLRDKGFVTLLVDSFKPRGEREICTQKNRKVSEVRDRPRDAHAALRWLAARSDVYANRVHLMGWSNGAIAVLNTLGPDSPGFRPDDPKFRSAVAFYPGCAALARKPYRPLSPLLIQSGAADDWTPARHCVAMASEAKAGGAEVEIDVYEGAHHGFDAPGGTLRSRFDVRNPSSPSGWGATVGPNPEARAKAIRRATEFLEAHR